MSSQIPPNYQDVNNRYPPTPAAGSKPGDKPTGQPVVRGSGHPEYGKTTIAPTGRPQEKESP